VDQRDAVPARPADLHSDSSHWPIGRFVRPVYECELHQYDGMRSESGECEWEACVVDFGHFLEIFNFIVFIIIYCSVLVSISVTLIQSLDYFIYLFLFLTDFQLSGCVALEFTILSEPIVTLNLSCFHINTLRNPLKSNLRGGESKEGQRKYTESTIPKLLNNRQDKLSRSQHGKQQNDLVRPQQGQQENAMKANLEMRRKQELNDQILQMMQKLKNPSN
jgi:hypothetical protein